MAFEVLYERHLPPILSFCRHMLGSSDEAEDAVQNVFVSAHRHILANEREITFKPWLYAIARNRCLSMLRARRENATEEIEVSTRGLDEVVQERADLRSLLADLGDLPDDQRAALVLMELGDLSHVEVADVLGREARQVKGLVYRARSGLAERREAREASCGDIRVELANARGGGLRRGRLSHHLKACPSCAAFMEDLRRQRRMMGLILPVAPTVGLKDSVLGALAAGGGGVAAATGGITSAGGVASLVAASAAKIAAVGVIAGGAGVAIVAGKVDRDPSPPAQRGEPASPGTSAPPASAGSRGLSGGTDGDGRTRGLGDAARGEGGPASQPRWGRAWGRWVAGARGNGKGQGSGSGAPQVRGGTRGKGRGATGKPDVPPGRARARTRSAPSRGTSDSAPAPRGRPGRGAPPAGARKPAAPGRPGRRAKPDPAAKGPTPRMGRPPE